MGKRGQSGPKNPADFLFINATSDNQPSRGHQHQVKSHVSRGRPRKRTGRQVTPWLAGRDGEIQVARQASQLMLERSPNPSVGLSLAGLPDGLRLEMVHTAVEFLAGVNRALYPEEICMSVQTQGSPWIEYLMIDQTYLHAILYASECQGNILLGRDQDSRPAQFHLSKTLKLLADRISNSDDPLAVADQTIMTTVVLAFASEALGEGTILTNHLCGLMKMVALRGGFDRVGAESDMLAAKICRVDLGAALRFNRRPMFFARDISWDRYFEGPGTPATTTAEVEGFIQSLDRRLFGVWQDMRHFSYLCNLACSTGYKLDHELYSDIMASVLYRLLHMTLEPDCFAASTLRCGLVALASSLFLRWQGVGSDHNGSFGRFGDALKALRESDAMETVPGPLLLWMLMLWQGLRHAETPPYDEQWASEVIGRLAVASWQEARQLLNTMVWIEFLHGPQGKAAFVRSLPASGSPKPDGSLVHIELSSNARAGDKALAFGTHRAKDIKEKERLVYTTDE